MIRSGMASVTFRDLAPPEIVDVAQRAGLQAVEWGGDVHVPHGDLERAREVGALTRDAGLEVASYGSYYRVGCRGGDYPSFDEVLETALALDAPAIRVWAGDRGTADAGPHWWTTVVNDVCQIAGLASGAGLPIAFEFHGHTLTDSAESAERLMQEVDRSCASAKPKVSSAGHPNVSCYWQLDRSLTPAARLEGLRRIAPWLANLHVFYYRGDKQAALAEGADEWRRYLGHAVEQGGDRYALLEFVEDGRPENLERDAATLIELLAELQPA